MVFREALGAGNRHRFVRRSHRFLEAAVKTQGLASQAIQKPLATMRLEQKFGGQRHGFFSLALQDQGFDLGGRMNASVRDLISPGVIAVA